jgi:hypothetical protein
MLWRAGLNEFGQPERSCANAAVPSAPGPSALLQATRTWRATCSTAPSSAATCSAIAIRSSSAFLNAVEAEVPAVRQNRSKLTETASQALPTAPLPVGGEAIDVVLTFFMALLSFVDSTPRAYRLKASNAAPPISTFAGAILVELDGLLSWKKLVGRLIETVSAA